LEAGSGPRCLGSLPDRGPSPQHLRRRRLGPRSGSFPGHFGPYPAPKRQVHSYKGTEEAKAQMKRDGVVLLLEFDSRYLFYEVLCGAKGCSSAASMIPVAWASAVSFDARRSILIVLHFFITCLVIQTARSVRAIIVGRRRRTSGPMLCASSVTN
jgi:hypothetical protein